MHYCLKIVFTLLLSLLFIHVSLVFSAPQNNRQGVVVSEHPLATAVGLDILKKGGNAVDAATAVGYALGVVFPSCGNIGGGGFMLIRFANGKSTVLNFRETAPSLAKPSLYFDDKGNPLRSSVLGYAGVGIPGTVKGLNTALQKYGTMDLETVMQPAIHLARDGFALSPADAHLLKANEKYFITQPNVAAIFLKNDKPYRAGDRLVQKDLSKTYELIAQQGSDVFYKGKIADEIVKASQQQGGFLRKQDFIDYRVSEVPPLICSYRGYKIITVPPPASGLTLCEMLNITEGYPLAKLGYHTSQSAHYIIEAMRHAYADRGQYIGDPNFTKIPLQRLLSKEYASEIRAQILANKAGHSKMPKLKTNSSNSHETTGYAVADKKGNVVVVVYTINQFFGAKVIAGNTGFFLNNELDDFTLRLGVPNFYGLIQGKVNLIEPDKRPLSGMTPVIVTKNNDFFLALGTPGGSTIPTQTLLGIENVIDYHMNIKDAVYALRFHMQWLPDIVFMEPNAFSPHVIQELQQMGYHLKTGSPFDTLYWGSMVGIHKDPKTHQLSGAAEERESASSPRNISY